MLNVFEKDGLYGYKDEMGRVIISPRYVEARAFENGLAIIGNEKRLFGAIDQQGQQRIDFKYQYLDSFRDNPQYTRFGNIEEPALYGLVDHNGREIIPMKYHWIQINDPDHATVGLVLENGDKKEGEFNFKDQSITWNSHWDSWNEVNHKVRELDEAFPALIKTYYSSGCPCIHPRFINYLEYFNSSGTVQFIDAICLWKAARDTYEQVTHVSDILYQCKKCGARYQQDSDQLNAFYFVDRVRCVQQPTTPAKGPAAVKPIPAYAGFQYLGDDAPNESLVKKAGLKDVVAYLAESIK